jgi:hypothetical protein
MKREMDMSLNQLFEYLTSLKYSKYKIRMYMQGWQDGDYFEELCLEDGGILADHLELFKKLPLFKKIKDIPLLIEEISKYEKYPYLRSKNGNYKYYYDIEIWVNDIYIIYNIHLKKAIIKKRNLIEKIFGIAIDPKWQFWD